MAPKGFVGRRETLDWVCRTLGGGSSLSGNLYGEPQTGKTAVLRQLCDWEGGLHAEGKVALVEAASIAHCDSSAFWQGLLETINGEVKSAGRSGTSRAFFDAFDEALAARRERGEARLFVLVDDFDLFVPGLGENDFHWLRHLVSEYRGDLAFLFSSTDSLQRVCDRELDLEKASPFLNLVESRQLGLLSKEEAEQLVKGSAFDEGVRMEHSELRFFLREFGRHPGLLSLGLRYAREITGVASVKQGEVDLDEVKYDIRNEPSVRGLCELLCQRRGPLEKKALWSVIEGEVTDRVIKRRLERLGLIEAVDNGDQLFSEAFQYWVQAGQGALDSTRQPGLDFQYRPDGSWVQVGGARKELTAGENRLLRYLWENRGRIVSVSELLESVWGRGRSKAVVEKGINRLREKIETNPRKPQRLISVRGQGYRLDLP